MECLVCGSSEHFGQRAPCGWGGRSGSRGSFGGPFASHASHAGSTTFGDATLVLQQWEAWLYIHKAINFSNEPDKEEIMSDLSIPIESSLFVLNLREFGVFNLLECTYLFRKKGFKSYLIDLNLFDFLKKSITKPIKRTEINEVVFSQLYQNRVLITAQ